MADQASACIARKFLSRKIPGFARFVAMFPRVSWTASGRSHADTVWGQIRSSVQASLHRSAGGARHFDADLAGGQGYRATTVDPSFCPTCSKKRELPALISVSDVISKLYISAFALYLGGLV